LTDLSIIIVSFNARADLERCLESLHSPAPSIAHEVIVVDNQSSDGSAAAARRWPGVKVIDAGANLGFARGTNLGIRASTGTSLLLLNSDTIAPPGAIDRLVAELDRHPEAAVMGPRLVDGRGRAELSFGPMLGPFSEVRQKLLFRGQVNGLPILSGIVERTTRRPHAPGWVSGACLLVRRDDAEAVGLLDERYFLYTEDVDFCAAIRARGRKILFTPTVEIVHLRGRSAASVPSETRRAYRQSQLAFYEKHHPGWAPLLRLYLGLRGQL
jgi:N-acetylglucosaminyl-diphospho-decaprenol L-rhamnosyltransferase